jgi:hypothetical protein
VLLNFGTTFARLRLTLGSIDRILLMNERFAGHNEAREALVLSVTSVTAIMLTAYLILLILY